MAFTRFPLGRAHLLASSLAHHVQRAGLPLSTLVPLGSVRRYAAEVGDVALLAVAEAGHHGAILDGLGRLTSSVRVLRRSKTSVALSTDRGPVTVHVATPQVAGAAMVWHTGSRRHTTALQARATARGLTLAEGLLRREDEPLDTPTEDDVYRHLDLPYIPPELREDGHEIQTAERGALPVLVTAAHIRGDLHAHSTWSDGRNTVEEMVRAARDLGYAYFAITDHSEGAMASRTLRAADVVRQRQEIDALRSRTGVLEILHGVEVDILEDGTLDFPDALLETFDIVLASLHQDAGHDAERLSARYLAAIRHPLVNVITHPANRSPGVRTGYDLDFDRLFDAAVDTGTAMEIDGAPGHLDMDGALARRAAAKGVTLVIDSDCHRAEALGRQMDFGVGTARRGWVEPRHVLNTKRADEVRSFVARKRARRAR